MKSQRAASGAALRARHGSRRARTGPLLAPAAVPAALWLACFVIAPGLLIVFASFWTSDLFGLHPRWTLHQWQRIFSTPLYLSLLLKTARIALLSTACSLVIGYPVALYLNSLRGTARRAALMTVFIPFWVGFVVRTFAWLPILGRHGLVNLSLKWLGITDAPSAAFLYNEGAVYLGLVSGYLVFMILPIYLSLEGIRGEILEAAADLNAGPWRTFRFIQLPLSMPGVISGCVMVTLLNFGAYVTPALLGGPSGIMFANAVAQQFIADNNWAFGSCLSVLMTVVVLLGLFAATRHTGTRAMLSAEQGMR